MKNDINTLNSEDVLDVRDIIERVEELESDLLECFNEQQELEGDDTTTDDVEDSAFKCWLGQTTHEDASELQTLTAILEDLKGYGGDEQWRGDWYPVTLIRESYFTDYTEELVSDCYSLNVPDWVHIDWEATAREVMVDYSQTDIDGVTYLYR